MFAVLRSLGWPLTIGLSCYAGLYILMRKEVITNPLLVRYLESHPVSYVATAMFCVGIAALLIKAIDGIRQWTTLSRISLAARPDSPQPVSECGGLLEQLEQHPESLHDTLLWRRLYNSLRFVEQKSSAEGLDEELKYLSDSDANQQHESYSLVRILIWATPMLGFLGTVIGISEALGGLEVGGGNFESMMQGLRNSLYVAFDTTALALTLSIILMFVQFLVDRFESQFLLHVDQQVNADLVGRFEEVGGGNDPVVKSLERLATTMLSVSEKLVERQADVWQASMERANIAWQTGHQENSQQIRHELDGALTSALESFADRMQETQQSTEQAAHHRWEQLQVAISENARRMADHQQELASQTDILRQAIEATSEVTGLEQALNRNLSALSDAGRFEETITSLAATIHLLNARLRGTGTPNPIDLSSSETRIERHETSTTRSPKSLAFTIPISRSVDLHNGRIDRAIGDRHSRSESAG